MSNECGDKDDAADRAVTALLTRAATADSHADDRLRVAIADFFLADAARLDDRTRIAVAATLGGLVQAVAGALRHHAARLLLAREAAPLSAAIEAEEPSIFQRLAQAGVLRDPELMRELLGRVQQDLLTDALSSRAILSKERKTSPTISQNPLRAFLRRCFLITLISASTSAISLRVISSSRNQSFRIPLGTTRSLLSRRGGRDVSYASKSRITDATASQPIDKGGPNLTAGLSPRVKACT